MRVLLVYQNRISAGVVLHIQGFSFTFASLINLEETIVDYDKKNSPIDVCNGSGIGRCGE